MRAPRNPPSDPVRAKPVSDGDDARGADLDVRATIVDPVELDDFPERPTLTAQELAGLMGAENSATSSGSDPDQPTQSAPADSDSSAVALLDEVFTHDEMPTEPFLALEDKRHYPSDVPTEPPPSRRGTAQRKADRPARDVCPRPPTASPAREDPASARHPAAASALPSPTVGRLAVQMRERFAAHDYEATHQIAKEILETDPGHVGAKNCLDRCCRILEQQYYDTLGGPSAVPLVLARGKLATAQPELDHRTGFLLSLIDGTTSVEELVDVSGMSKIQVLRTLCDLVGRGIISLK